MITNSQLTPQDTTKYPSKSGKFELELTISRQVNTSMIEILKKKKNNTQKECLENIQFYKRFTKWGTKHDNDGPIFGKTTQYLNKVKTIKQLNGRNIQ